LGFERGAAFPESNPCWEYRYCKIKMEDYNLHLMQWERKKLEKKTDESA